MRLLLIALLVLAPTALAATEAVTVSLASEGVLNGRLFNVAFEDAPVTATRNGVQGAAIWSFTSDTATPIQARYIVDGATSFVPVVISGSGHGPDKSTGTLLVDVAGVGAASGFRASFRLAGADGTFAGQGSLAHGAAIGAAAGVATTE